MQKLNHGKGMRGFGLGITTYLTHPLGSSRPEGLDVLHHVEEKGAVTFYTGEVR
jgi:hypothetical protein